jgi:O-antigen/teichoic acid export membrane protein
MAANPLKKLAGETLIYGLGTIVPRLLNYLLVPFYTIFVFNKSQYGEITELYAYVALLMVLLTYGMETAFFRYANLYKNQVKKVFNTATTSLLITSSLFVLLVFVNKSAIADLIQYGGHSEYIVLISLIVALDAFTSLPFAYLRYQNKAKKFSMIRVINVVVNIGLNILFLIVIPRSLGDTYQSHFLYRSIPLVGWVFISNLVASITTLLLLWQVLNNFRLEIDKTMLIRLLIYGLPILLIGFAGMINEVSDKILLRYLLPPTVDARAVIGVYGANYKLAILMMLFIQMFRYAAEPFFFSEHRKKDAKRTYSRVMTVFTAFSWFIFLMVTLYLDGFKYFIGKAFWAGLTIVPIVLSAKLFLGLFYNLSVWYKLTNKTLYGGLIALAGAVITIVMNVILIPHYGYVGSAWANFSAYLSMLILSYFWGRKIFPVPYNLKKILFLSGLAVAVYFTHRMLPDFSMRVELMTSSFLLLFYTVAGWFTIRNELR